jgi:hypothetical protein
MSRYRSVPVSTTTSGPAPAAAQSAIDAAERRACSAIIRSSGSPRQRGSRRTRQSPASIRAQRPAVRALPLLLCGAAGLMMPIVARAIAVYNAGPCGKK